ncbi:MAG: MBL fold metallo-hydrolase [Anaerolineales bacterium]|jgi:glyoxylase-like metal-dependent hydrolase (beta-lactamase superfamily II)
MRRVASQVWIEDKYPSGEIGVVASQDEVMLIDAPLLVDDVKQWLTEVEAIGEVRYLAVIDSHPDRVLGTRVIDLPRISHDLTLEMIQEWSDTFKGNTHPIGAESDRLKRVTGVQASLPEITFNQELILRLGNKDIRLLHRTGPRPGSIWVLEDTTSVVFVGDAVTVNSPPYLGVSDLELWLDALDDLRKLEADGYKVISAHGGHVGRDAINNMARFLRKVENRLEKVDKADDHAMAAMEYAEELMGDFKVSNQDRESALIKLQTGLIDLYELLQE